MRFFGSKPKPSHSNGKKSTQPIPVTVFWDFENISLSQAHLLPEYVLAVLQSARPRQSFIIRDIIAKGNLKHLRGNNCKHKMTRAGISLEQTTSRKESAADLAIVEGILSFVLHNKPPHIVILISGDSDFARYALSSLPSNTHTHLPQVNALSHKLWL